LTSSKQYAKIDSRRGSGVKSRFSPSGFARFYRGIEMVYFRTVARLVGGFITAAALTSCLFQTSSSTGTGSPTNGNATVPGKIAILAQHCYVDPNLINLGDLDADTIEQGLAAHGWTITEYIHDTLNFSNTCDTDPVIFSSQFTDATARSSDALWFSGHGTGPGGGPGGATTGWSSPGLVDTQLSLSKMGGGVFSAKIETKSWQATGVHA